MHVNVNNHTHTHTFSGASKCSKTSSEISESWANQADITWCQCPSHEVIPSLSTLVLTLKDGENTRTCRVDKYMCVGQSQHITANIYSLLLLSQDWLYVWPLWKCYGQVQSGPRGIMAVWFGMPLIWCKTSYIRILNAANGDPCTSACRPRWPTLHQFVAIFALLFHE